MLAVCKRANENGNKRLEAFCISISGLAYFKIARRKQQPSGIVNFRKMYLNHVFGERLDLKQLGFFPLQFMAGNSGNDRGI